MGINSCCGPFGLGDNFNFCGPSGAGGFFEKFALHEKESRGGTGDGLWRSR